LVAGKLAGRVLRTTYKDRNGFFKIFTFDSITEKGANRIMAYGKLPQPFNCSVATHFYARHRIRLHCPYNHCIIEYFKNGQHRFYPIELLELVGMDENPLDLHLPPLQIDENEYEDDGWGRATCSQKNTF
jgi:hypothetical protein